MRLAGHIGQDKGGFLAKRSISACAESNMNRKIKMLTPREGNAISVAKYLLFTRGCRRGRKSRKELTFSLQSGEENT